MKGASSISQYGKKTNTGKTKLYQEIKEGRLKAVKLGSKTLIRDDDGDEWLANLPVLNTKNTA